MTRYHAVMEDECGGEFGVDIEAFTKEDAHAELRDMYAESRCVQLESPEDTQKREGDMHRHIARGGDWDDEGRPIFPGGEPDDDWEDEEDDDFEDDVTLL